MNSLILAEGPRGPIEMLALVIVAGMVVAWMVYTAKQRKQIARKRAVLGQKLGLRTRESSGRVLMEGDYRGFQVEVDMFIQRSGRTELEFTRVSVVFPESLRLGLKVTRRTLVGKLGNVLRNTTKLGHHAFDENFITVARSRRQARQRLSEDLFRAMVRFVNSRGHLDLDDDGFSFETSGWIKENSKLHAILKQLVEMAGAVFPDALREAPTRKRKLAHARASSSKKRKLGSKKASSARSRLTKAVPRRRKALKR